jgi:FkbM family methyltransferase
MTYYNESNTLIDITNYETFEQRFAEQYVLSSDCVLELGARYGVVSGSIQKNKPAFHIAVEPDASVWDILEKNIAYNSLNTRIFKGFISKCPLSLNYSGLSSHYLETQDQTQFVNSKSLEDVVNIFQSPPITALIADCEGGLEIFLKDNLHLAKTLRMICYEQDNGQSCNYKWIEEHLIENGMTCVQLGFHKVWLRIKAKLLTFSNDVCHPGLKMLKTSLNKFGWDYEILSGSWKGFGTKHLEAGKYITSKLTSDYTHVFVVDAFDVVVLGSMEDAIRRLQGHDFIFNAEKACYPQLSLAPLYPTCSSESKYLNGGMLFAKREIYLDSLKEMKNEDNDQLYYSKKFVEKRHYSCMEWFGESYTACITLDTECTVFQCYSFIHEGEFEFRDQKIFNKLHNTYPILIHGNGKTDMKEVYKLLI